MIHQVDLHGFESKEAKKFLDHYLDRLPMEVKEVTVIHGYHSGRVLQSYIRKHYHHKRLKRVLLTMNMGETILVLK